MTIEGRKNDRLWHRRALVRATLAFAFGTLAGLLFARPNAKPAAPNKSAHVQIVSSTAGNHIQRSNHEPSGDFGGGLENFSAELDHALRKPGLASREQALFEIRRKLQPVDVPQALALLQANQDQRAVDLQVCLAGRWAESNPKAAFSWAQSLKRSQLRSNALRTVLAEWAVSDIETALTWVNSLATDDERQAGWGSVLETIARQNPQRAFGLVRAVPARLRGPLQELVLQRWAAQDPHAAVSAMAKAEGLSASLYSEVASQWASSEPKAAVEWAQKLSPAEFLESALRGSVAAWARGNPREAAAFANKQSGKVRSTLLGVVAIQWASTDPAEAGAWAAMLPTGAERGRVVNQVVSVWAEANPDGAARYALEGLAGDSQLKALESVAAAWARQDAGGVTEWERSLPASIRPQVASRILAGLVESEPAAIANLVMSLDAKDRAAFSTDAATAWAQHDLAGAVEWLNQLPPGGVKDAVLTGLLGEWALYNPKEAGDYLLRTLPSDSSRDDKVFTLTEAWGQDRTEEAAKWITNLPDGNKRDAGLLGFVQGWVSISPIEAATYAVHLTDGVAKTEAISVVAECWAVSDPEPAANWVQSFPAGNLRDDAIAAVAKAWARDDAGAAIAWLKPLCDSNRFTHNVIYMLGYWFNQDPGRALVWLQNSDLPADMKIQWVRGR